MHDPQCNEVSVAKHRTCVWQMNEGDISYKDSLMWYVKDLGPTAQLVAKRKLLGQHESSSLRRSGAAAAKEFKTFRDFAPPAGSSPSPFVKAIRETKMRGRRKEKLMSVEASTSHKPALSSAKNRVSNSSPRPVILALESHHSKAGDRFKSTNKKSCIVFDADVQQQKEKEKEKEKKALPLISHFTFDLPFFKARLDQMKAAII